MWPPPCRDILSELKGVVEVELNLRGARTGVDPAPHDDDVESDRAIETDNCDTKCIMLKEVGTILFFF